MKFISNILKVVFVIIGTLIGAGFASGQEIYVFFFSFGINGLFGILVSSIIIGLIIYKSFLIIQKKDIKNYKELLNNIMKNEKLREITNIIVNIFILISFYIMVAGFGAYLKQEFSLNNIIGSGILALLCLVIFKTNIKGFVKINEILIPILIFIVILIGIINIKNINFTYIDHYLVVQNEGSWIVTSILYASYNSVLLIPVLISIKDYIGKIKNIKYISIIVTLITIFLISIVYLLLINVDVNIKELEMPAIYAIDKICHNMKNVYGLIILISIFTTAISLGISFLNNVAYCAKKYNIVAFFICITSVVFSGVGFSNLVNLFYPILGTLGLVQIIQIFLAFL